MLKYMIFILIFNILYSLQGEAFDIYEIKNHKPADNPIKRQLGAEGKVNIESNPEEPIESHASRHENTDSVKKDLQENDKPKTDVNSANSQTSDTKDNQEKKVDTPQKQETNHEQHSEDLNNPINSQNKTETVIVADSNKNSTENDVKKHNSVEHPGAALRGFYVFLGLSVLIIIYFVFKAFKLRPGAPPPTTVRKYGIVGRRNDMEMLPLPLVDEDDDDTLFDMGTHGHR